MTRDPEAAGITYLGVTLGFPLSALVVWPARPSSAPLQAVRTLNPYMLVMQALQVLQRPWRVKEKFGPLRRVTSLRALAIMSHETFCRALSEMLLVQSPGGDLEGTPSHILRASSWHLDRRMTLKSVVMGG